MTGIPTKYKGVQFRSRTEAKWAAFFDLIGWKWDYEPFDLDGWIPDFYIHGEKPLLIEVKAEMTYSPLLEHVPKIRAAKPQYDVLIVGAVPILEDIPTNSCYNFAPSRLVGPLLIATNKERVIKGVWSDCSGQNIQASTEHEPLSFYEGHFTCRCTPPGLASHESHYTIKSFNIDWPFEHDVSGLTDSWAEACNEVQWKKP